MSFVTGLIKCAAIDPVTLGVLGGSSLGAILAANGLSKRISPFATEEDIEKQRLLHILAGASVGGVTAGLSGKGIKELANYIKKEQEEKEEPDPIVISLMKKE